MKKYYTLSVAFVFISLSAAQAQNWLNGGNALTANGSFGTKSNFSVVFLTNNVDRGRILNTGNWAIGTTTAYSKLTVNTPTATSPFQANINNYTKLMVHSNGGTSIGTAAGGPVDGLYVLGSVGIGVAAPTAKLEVLASPGMIAVSGKGASYGTYGEGSLSGAYGYGTSYGVFGSSPAYAVYGSGGIYGIYGIGTKYGVFGVSSNYGVYGQGLYALYGLSSGGYGAALTSGGHGIDATSTSTAGNFYGGVFHHNVYVYGTVAQTSDRRMKKNINDVKDAMSAINRLKPMSYEYKQDGEYAKLYLPLGKHYGLMAQDLEEVLPDLVMPAPFGEGGDSAAATLEAKEASSTIKGGKGINYTELIPILIKGMQEQDSTMQTRLAQLEDEVTELKSIIQQLQEGRGSDISFGAWIRQNSPNPFKGNTTIQYFIPASARNARLQLTNSGGQLLKYWTLSTGEGTINVGSDILTAGTYNYSLIVDGKVVTTKKMSLSK